LVEELKSRAKGCLSSKNYPEAITLYSKGIHVCTDNAALSILHANRSMCYLNMSKTAEAVNDATDAIRLDANYIKAYYRLAMAQMQANQYQLAKEALQQGLKLKGDDKELSEQLKRVEDRLANPTTASSPAAAPPRAMNKVSVAHSPSSSKPVTSSTVPKPAAPKPDTSKPQASSSSKKKSAEEDDEPDEDDEDLKNVRGYKKTADGRTTTFFNRDLDENTKALIGNIAPKKLEGAQGEVITTGTTVGSAWNAAGTYEEKILTPWVISFLTTEFSHLSQELPNEKLDASVRSTVSSVLIESTGTENMNGHAQVTVARGKTKHMCDFSMNIKWTVTVTNKEEIDNKVTGQLTVQDLTADEEYEITDIQIAQFNDQATNFNALPRDIQAVINKYIKSSDHGLQKLIQVHLEKFWRELLSKK
jgi:hypothetical protein